MNNYIAINRNIMGGEPVIAGTRIPVVNVFHLYKKEHKNKRIIATEYYPQLNIDQVGAAIKWFEENKNCYGRLAL